VKRKQRKYPMRPMAEPAPFPILGQFWITYAQWDKEPLQSVRIELQSHGAVDAVALFEHMKKPQTVRFAGPNSLMVERLA
jgi:hypothetical protein